MKKSVFRRWLPLYVFLIVGSASWFVGQYIVPVATMGTQLLEVKKDSFGDQYYIHKGKKVYPNIILASQSRLMGNDFSDLKRVEFIEVQKDGKTEYLKASVNKHFRYWSLLPAVMAIALCFITKEPLTSLIGGIISGALILQKYNITEEVFVQELMTKNAAGVLILYLWLLGALMGIWSKTGAAQAFGDLMRKKFVRGPRSAKLVAWALGILFFQGGTVSTVLVGTTVKPITDKQNVSHEEVAYIVDSTASPIASQLAFNAWPGYIQSFIYVAGVSFLATEADRISFFFRSVPFCFYAIFAVLFTFFYYPLIKRLF